MKKKLISKALDKIEEELRRIAREEPITKPHLDAPLWTKTVLDKAASYSEFGDEADDVTEAVEDLRREQQRPLLSMKVQALHDDTVVFSAWNLPKGVTAYLVESWNGEPELFAIDEEVFSDERATGHVSKYLRSVYVGCDPEPDGSEVLQISPLDVEVNLQTRRKEIDILYEAALGSAKL